MTERDWVPVAGNNAETTPELMELLSVAPETVKKLAPTPDRVYPVAGLMVMFAVYAVPGAKVPETVGDQETVAVY